MTTGDTEPTQQQPQTPTGAPGQGGDGDGRETVTVRDRRRIDPETGEPRATGTTGATGEDDEPAAEPTEPAEPAAGVGGSDLAAERLADLQRLQAEYVNYRKRVERDRDVARDTAVAGVLETLLPALDDIHLARQHGDLEGGPFAAIADKARGRAGPQRPAALRRGG
ncbi:hypothetical protein GCM10025868_25340 [Angustibacter aerolatus]|uniref:Nucleotide exchange factor GrpE n=1 Tax=Angustibacter aerolatus TaxID=1162965 RepID=A0ABQ6JHI2_9ACTN|nr:nucleotide exchange factor GrpE [Angustibacter aerolatus]GMA87284.1 hypothetical protein GCM10025868_25340 [Angustibacter aerolatus]